MIIAKIFDDLATVNTTTSYTQQK